MGRGGVVLFAGGVGGVKFSGTLGKCVLKKISGCGVEGFILSNTSAWCQTCSFGQKFYPAPQRKTPVPRPVYPQSKSLFFSLGAPHWVYFLHCNLKNATGRAPTCVGFSSFCGTNKFALEFTACLDHVVDFVLRGFETENSKMSNAFDDKQDHLVWVF